MQNRLCQEILQGRRCFQNTNTCCCYFFRVVSCLVLKGSQQEVHRFWEESPSKNTAGHLRAERKKRKTGGVPEAPRHSVPMERSRGVDRKSLRSIPRARPEGSGDLGELQLGIRPLPINFKPRAHLEGVLPYVWFCIPGWFPSRKDSPAQRTWKRRSP